MDDDASAMVAGFVATVVIIVLLILADMIVGVSIRPFVTLSNFIGLADHQWVGVLVFFGGGTVLWPFMFITVGRFLPGRTDAIRGMVFSAILWTGFVFLFASGGGGPEDLAAYAILTLIAHLAYGFTLGVLFDYLGDHTVELV